MNTNNFSRVNEGLDRGEAFEFLFDGKPVKAYPGETIAAALMSDGQCRLGTTEKMGNPRGFYCGMGICWACRMIVDGQPNVRSCNMLASPGMRVETQRGLGSEVKL